MIGFLAVAAGGALGAMLRHAVEATLRRRFPALGAWSIGLVNVAGSFGLGVCVAALPAGWTLDLVGVGILGAFTTFSTACLDLVRLIEDRRPGASTTLALLVLVGSVAAASLGVATGSRL